MNPDHKNSLWLGLQFFISLALSMIGLKLNLLTFGDDLFSIWLLLLSVWGIGSALDLGFGLSIVRFVARSGDDKVSASKIISTSLFLFLLVGLVIFLVSMVVGEVLYFSNHKLIPEILLGEARLVFIILGGNFYFQYITIVLRSALEGHNDYLTPSKISLVYSILIFTFTFATYIFKLTLSFLAFFYLVSSCVQLLSYLYFYNKSYSFLKLSPKYFEKDVIKKIASFSISIQATFFIGSLIDPLIKYIIGNFFTRTLIPTYEIARKFSTAVSGLFNFSFRNNLPKVSVLHARKELQEFLYTRGILVSKFGITYSAVVFGLVSIVFAMIFKYFYKNEESLVVFYILALAESVNNTGYIFYMFIIGQGKAIFLSILQAVNLILTAVCVSGGLYYFNTSLGLIGLFVAVLSANVFMLLYVKKMTSVEVLYICSKMQVWKLFVLIVAICSMVFSVVYYPKYWLWHHIALIIVTLVFFSRDTMKILEYVFPNIARFNGKTAQADIGL